MVYSKDEATNFNNNIANTDNFKYFGYKAKLLEDAVADEANGIVKNATVAVPLKYVINFWVSLEIPCVLSAAGNENQSDKDNNNNVNNIIFTIKDTQIYVPVVTLSAKDNQKLSKLLSKGFERSV